MGIFFIFGNVESGSIAGLCSVVQCSFSNQIMYIATKYYLLNKPRVIYLLLGLLLRLNFMFGPQTMMRVTH